jgi:peptidoglycan/LPS O-acetylase OafA/YrhL
MLRFVAALFVVLFHYGDEAPVALSQLHPLFSRGYLATDFFLMLSGYVLGRAYGAVVEGRRLAAGEFFVRRLARIWPSHLIVLAMMVGVVLLTSVFGLTPHHAGRFQWSDLAPQLLLFQAWGDWGGFGWNIPTWSLSALVVCYAIFPALWRLLARAPMSAIVATSLAVVWLADAVAHRFVHQGLFDLPYYYGVFRALPLFLSGMTVALWVQREPLKRPMAITCAMAAAVIFILVQSFGRHDMISVAMIATIVLSAGSLTIRRPSALVAKLGQLSFSLFITHVLFAVLWFGVLHAVGEQSMGGLARWSLWAASLPGVLLAALVFDRFVDQPVQIWLTPRLKAIFRVRPSRYPEPGQSA